LTHRCVPLADIVEVECGGRVVVWELHGRVHAQYLLCARKTFRPLYYLKQEVRARRCRYRAPV
jgi:hypothetical protein